MVSTRVADIDSQRHAIPAPNLYLQFLLLSSPKMQSCSIGMAQGCTKKSRTNNGLYIHNDNAMTSCVHSVKLISIIHAIFMHVREV